MTLALLAARAWPQAAANTPPHGLRLYYEIHGAFKSTTAETGPSQVMAAYMRVAPDPRHWRAASTIALPDTGK